jgi:hypothetical protein
VATGVSPRTVNKHRAVLGATDLGVAVADYHPHFEFTTWYGRRTGKRALM